MSKTKHTPGPWVVEELGFYTKQLCIHRTGRRDSHGHVCTINGEKGAPGHFKAMSERQIADAALIAAAPDLLEALKDVFALMEEGVLVRDISHDGSPDYGIRMMGLVSRLKKAHDAVAKAEDRSDV